LELSAEATGDVESYIIARSVTFSAPQLVILRWSNQTRTKREGHVEGRGMRNHTTFWSEKLNRQITRKTWLCMEG